MPNINKEQFWQYSTDYWFQQLQSSPNGLTNSVAEKLLRLQRPNLKTQSRLQKEIALLLGQFKSPLMLMLIGAVILSAVLGDTSDVFIILFIVVSTGLLSFFQERNANRVVVKLQSMIALKCVVLRDGKAMQINSDKIIAGDVIQLKAGDMIPGDCLIISSNELSINESSLTGESFPVNKAAGILDKNTELPKRSNTLWEGSNVISGNATALVIATGDETVFGNIIKSSSKVYETTFERGIKDFGFFLMKITLVLSVCILIINLLNHKSAFDSVLFALALAVGMAPELLPAITTIAMSAGARRMLEKKVIVKKLSSIQNLGEINLLCTDKTGTITEGSIKVSGLINFQGTEDAFVKEIAYWNATFETGYFNPIDDALRKIEYPTTDEVKKTGEVPYDFNRKRLSIGISKNNQNIIITKGAYSSIQSICTRVRLQDGSITAIDAYKKELDDKFETFGQQGLRTIGICYKIADKVGLSKNDEADMIFAGFILLNDPVKKGITETVNALHQLMVSIKIITGDNRNVARSIAAAIGIENPTIMTGEDITKTSPEALAHLVKNVHLFAEVEPQQKQQIIFALKKTYTVAYMGDGINDVSAINAADVGISVENAVDVARDAADFVLMEKDLMVLAEGIIEGRKTFANTLKYIFINTGSTFGNMFSVAVASFLLPFLPMLPKQILLTNFITDFPYLSISGDNVDQQQLNKPGKWNLKFIRNYMVIFGIHSSLFDLITFLTLLYLLKAKEATFQTSWFVESILTELLILFIIRTQKNFFKSKPAKYLFGLSVLAFFITVTLPYFSFAADLGFVPLSFLQLGAMLTIVLVYLLTADFLKMWFFKKYQAEG